MTAIKKVLGRPRGFDKDKAEESALSHFWRDGYEATGMSTLTAAIGVSAPSIYAAFGSKAGLFGRTVQLYQAECAPVFKGAFAADKFDDFVTELLEGAVQCYTRPGRGRGCLVLDGTRNAVDPQAIEITERVRASFHTQTVEKLSSLGVGNPERVADACQTAMTGLSGAARHGLSRDRLLETAQILARGIMSQ